MLRSTVATDRGRRRTGRCRRARAVAAWGPVGRGSPVRECDLDPGPPRFPRLDRRRAAAVARRTDPGRHRVAPPGGGQLHPVEHPDGQHAPPPPRSPVRVQSRPARPGRSQSVSLADLLRSDRYRPAASSRRARGRPSALTRGRADPARRHPLAPRRAALGYHHVGAFSRSPLARRWTRGVGPIDQVGAARRAATSACRRMTDLRLEDPAAAADHSNHRSDLLDRGRDTPSIARPRRRPVEG